MEQGKHLSPIPYRIHGTVIFIYLPESHEHHPSMSVYDCDFRSLQTQMSGWIFSPIFRMVIFQRFQSAKTGGVDLLSRVATAYVCGRSSFCEGCGQLVTCRLAGVGIMGKLSFHWTFATSNLDGKSVLKMIELD